LKGFSIVRYNRFVSYEPALAYPTSPLHVNENPWEPQEDFPDIATPTLAEVYVNQGQIVEALSIYERIVADNPEDHVSRRRVLELQAMIAPPPPSEIKGDRKK
jgi:hypothetical protein